MSISKTSKFPFITQLKYCQKLDFEADPNKKMETVKKKLFVSISKSIKFPYITQLKYCQRLDFEADPIDKLKPSIKKEKNIDPNNKHPGVN